MNKRTAIAAGVFAIALFASFGGTVRPAEATTPPGQDHAVNVTITGSHQAGDHPNVTTQVTICTDGSGVSGVAHECTASVPAQASFDQHITKFYGVLVNGSMPVAARIASVSLDIETNAGVLGGDGQRTSCGAVTHVSPPAFEIFAAAKTGTPVSMDPSGTPGYSFDQLDDAAQAGAGAPQGNGWPSGIGQVPVLVPILQSLLGIPDNAIISRGYGVAVLSPGVSQTTVTILTTAGGGSPGAADAVTSTTILGNPFGALSTGGQSTVKCPPLTWSVTSRGTSLASAGSPTIAGGVVPGDFSPAAVATTNLTICSVGCTAGYEYEVILSSASDDDNDGVTNAEDNCPNISNVGQASFAGIGLSCNAGQGYDNNSAGSLAALAGCAVASTCTDIDGDGFLNRADNCPFAVNATQRNNDADGRGDACEGNGTDPAAAPWDNPAAIVKGTGTGYANGALPGMTTSGSVRDYDDVCKVSFTLGATTVTPPTTCQAFGPTDSPPGPARVWADSNDDGFPDYLCGGACVSGNVSRDHRSDTNGDGYSDADEGTPANCGAASCGSILTSGGSTSGTTAETNSCRNSGRVCGSGAATTWDPLRAARNQAGGAGTGCLVSRDQTARADVDLDGAVSIIDASKVSGWFGNDVGDATDPRSEGDLDGDGLITLNDVTIVTVFLGRNVGTNCTVAVPESPLGIGKITGHVYHESASPANALAGVVVVACPTIGIGFCGSGYTDSTGAYVIRFLPNAPYSVAALGSDPYVGAAISATVSDFGTTVGQDILLTIPPGTISGTVYLDALGPGNELAGAIVGACPTGGGAECRTATSTGLGAYTIPYLVDGSYDVTAVAPGINLQKTIGPIIVSGGIVGGQNIVIIPPTGGISGHVYANSVSPANALVGAQVSACPTAGTDPCRFATTDGLGAYFVGYLGNASYTVTAFPPGNFLRKVLSPVTVAGGAITTGQELIVSPPTPPPPTDGIFPSSGDAVPVVYWHNALTLTKAGCAGGTASYQVIRYTGAVIASGPMTEGPAGMYTAAIAPLYPNHDAASIAITIDCGGGPVTNSFSIYIDPSGFVKTQAGVPIVGATVTLLRSDSPFGPFNVVPNGSDVMSPMNRVNPDKTDASGHFGWDVTPGYYRVRASKPGCVSAASPSVQVLTWRAFATTGVLEIPPPVFDIDLRLICDDTDQDGYTNKVETLRGDHPTVYCQTMRSDIDDDGVVSILDFSKAAAFFGQSTSTTAPPRYDQGPPPFDGSISILDFSKMASVFQKAVNDCP